MSKFEQPTRAVLYLRISQDHTGEGLAVERQREDCEQIAEQRGWKIVGLYEDTESASDRNKKRPDYDRMVADYRAGAFEAIICWDLDRLTRQPRQLEDWIEAAEERGLRLVTANGEADLSTDGGRLYARVKAAVARGEIERKGNRQKSAAQQRAKHGKLAKGTRITGYTQNGETIPEEAALVRLIFERFTHGGTLYGIAKQLQADGVPTRTGGRWHPSSIRTILTNAKYAGQAMHKGEVVELAEGHSISWEPIIDVTTFDRVQAKLADPRRKRNREGTARKHLGSGIYLCGIEGCGRKLRSTGRGYWCPEGGHVTRSMTQVDAWVEKHMIERLRADDVREALTPTDDAEVARLDTEAKKLHNRLAATEADYDADLIDGARYKSKTSKINAELVEIERKRVKLLAGSSAAAIIAESSIAEQFKGDNLDVKRTLVEAFVEVRLYPHPRGQKTFDPATVKITPKGNSDHM